MPSKRSRKDVVSNLVTEYSTLASTTSFTDHELKAIFTSKEMETINDLLVDMKEATSENEKRAKLAGGINKYAGVLLKMLRKFGGMPV